jgi:phage-related protein
MTDDHKWNTTALIVIAVIGWGVSGLIGYATAQNAMNARVAVLESQFQDMRSQLSDIRADVKTLLRR